MPVSPILSTLPPIMSPNSKKAARNQRRSTPMKRASSETTSSSDGSAGDQQTALSDLESDLAASPASEYQPVELDEPIDYAFQNGDAVWVKTDDGEWLQGMIAGTHTRRGATRQKEGVFFPVAFRHNSRKYFAPLNGNIKPDNTEVRRLLSEEGWL